MNKSGIILENQNSNVYVSQDNFFYFFKFFYFYFYLQFPSNFPSDTNSQLDLKRVVGF